MSVYYIDDICIIFYFYTSYNYNKCLKNINIYIVPTLTQPEKTNLQYCKFLTDMFILTIYKVLLNIRPNYRIFLE